MLITLLPLLPRFVEFGGYRWEVRDTGGGAEGPGPNVFSADPRDVWIDAKGLHLRAAPGDGVWRCAQVVLDHSLGYGTYRFTLGESVEGLDRQAVIGLFTYDADAAEAHRELDIEVSRWADPLRSNAQFVVQPADRLGSVVRFELPALPTSVHQFEWLPESAAFSSRTAEGRIVAEHTFGQGVPHAGGERAMINLWLMWGKPPSDGKPIEVVVQSFRFTPAGKRRALDGLVPTGLRG